MSLDETNRPVIVRLEIEKAYNTLMEAEIMMRENMPSGAAGRLYYAVFHAVSALLVHDKIRIKSHKGAYTMFCLHYVNTGKVPREYGNRYRQLEIMREESDYNCFYEITIEELHKQIPIAKEMIDTIAAMVKE